MVIADIISIINGTISIIITIIITIIIINGYTNIPL